MIPHGLMRVQQRVAMLHTLSGTPRVRPGTAGFEATLAARLHGQETAATDLSARAPAASAAPSAPTAAPIAVRPALPVTGVAHPSRSYANGRIPAAAMDSIGRGHHRLWGPAAASFRHLLADAQRAGVDIGVTDSYRSYEGQVDVARRKGLYSEGGLAAKPGTSKHGWGLAVDLDLDTRAQRWMRANAGRYGFVEDTPREPWHWAYEAIPAA